MKHINQLLQLIYGRVTQDQKSESVETLYRSDATQYLTYLNISEALSKTIDFIVNDGLWKCSPQTSE